MKRIIKYFFLIVVVFLLFNYLTMLIWGKDNLLLIAAKDFGWNTKDNKVDLIVWNSVLLEDDNHNSLKDFNDSQIKEFINVLQKSGFVKKVIYKPEAIYIDSIHYKVNELNLLVFYNMSYLFYCEIFIGAYSPGFITDKTEYLFWFFGWHKSSEPMFGIS